MIMTRAWRIGRSLLLLTGLLSAAQVAEAQTCNGSPNGSSLAYEFGSMYHVSTQGAHASLVGSGMGLDASAGVISSSEFDVTGEQGSVRFSLLLGSKGKGLRICPGIGLGVLHQNLDVEPGVTVNQITAGGRASLGLGYLLPAYAGIELSPFVLGQYEYSATLYDLEDQQTDPNEAGDLRGQMELQYGLVARFKTLFVGFASHLTMDDPGGLYLTRFMAGFTFGR